LPNYFALFLWADSIAKSLSAIMKDDYYGAPNGKIEGEAIIQIFCARIEYLPELHQSLISS